MRLTRAIIIVAVVAALSGAPPSVSAAANELTSPQVSPQDGSVATVFTFRVRYDGAFAAASVSVAVADLILPMLLEDGESPTAGWWTVASTLPVGAWSTAFSATATRGPGATVEGPVVVVAGPASAMPAASTGPTPPSVGATPESVPAEDPGAGTASTAAPEEAPSGVPSSASAPSSPTAAAGSEVPAGASPSAGGPAAAPAGDRAAPEPSLTASGADASPAGGDAAAASAADAPSPSSGTPQILAAAGTEPPGRTASTGDLVSTLILLGLAGVASVAIIGTLLLVAGRGREPQRAAAATAPVGSATTRPRVARRAPASVDDPILAALGVEDEIAARRAIRRARQAHHVDAAPTDRPNGR